MSTAPEPSVPAPDPNRVRIFDTTLRDGEQSPGCTMNLRDKLMVAELLESMHVDIIEAGFAIASQGDFESVREIADLVERSKTSVHRIIAREKRMEGLSPAEAVPCGDAGQLGQMGQVGQAE